MVVMATPNEGKGVEQDVNSRNEEASNAPRSLDERDELASAVLDGEASEAERLEILGDDDGRSRVAALGGTSLASLGTPTPTAAMRDQHLAAALDRFDAQRLDDPPTQPRQSRLPRSMFALAAAVLAVVVGTGVFISSVDRRDGNETALDSSAEEGGELLAGDVPEKSADAAADDAFESDQALTDAEDSTDAAGTDDSADDAEFDEDSESVETAESAEDDGLDTGPVLDITGWSGAHDASTLWTLLVESVNDDELLLEGSTVDPLSPTGCSDAADPAWGELRHVVVIVGAEANPAAVATLEVFGPPNSVTAAVFGSDCTLQSSYLVPT